MNLTGAQVGSLEDDEKSLLLLGSLIFFFAEAGGKMAPSNARVLLDPSWIKNRQVPPDYVRFNPLVYSFDTMLPIVDFHMESYWEPSLRDGGALAWIAWLYLRLHILLGWVLTTLGTLGFAGLVPRD